MQYIFLRNGEVHTPLPDCFLNGITRQTIIKLEKMALRFLRDTLKWIVFHVINGTEAEVTPVGKIGDYNFEVEILLKI